VGAGSLVGAGSTITRDVPADSLAVARVKQKNLERKK
jgi:bifunctional UDP-N-acetylglucosamine pyrophosphorylase/glucosamine-1-phosphate N-acetyltransferase